MRRILPVIGVFLWFSPAGAAVLQCGATPVSVAGDETAAAAVCGIVEDALPELAACGVTLDRPIRIELVEVLPQSCLGLYHCGEDRIELMPPARFAAQRMPDSVFAAVPDDIFYRSVVIHELAHAAYDAVPCPIADCFATAEYVAFAMQMRALPEKMRQTVIGGAYADRRIGRDEINQTFMLMAPESFARKAWLHFSQRPDPCGYIGQIMSGDIVLDNERH